MIAILHDAGFEPEAPEDLMTWIKQDERRVAFLTLEAPHDWAVLAELRNASPDLIVVAVLADHTVPSLCSRNPGRGPCRHPAQRATPGCWSRILLSHVSSS
jgi:hypothetical protein